MRTPSFTSLSTRSTERIEIDFSSVMEPITSIDTKLDPTHCPHGTFGKHAVCYAMNNKVLCL